MPILDVNVDQFWLSMSILYVNVDQFMSKVSVSFGRCRVWNLQPRNGKGRVGLGFGSFNSYNWALPVHRALQPPIARSSCQAHDAQVGGKPPFFHVFVTQAAVCRLSGGVCLPAGVCLRQRRGGARQAGGWEFRV